MRKSILILSGAIIIFLVFGYVLLINPTKSKNTDLKVATTIYPLSDVVKNIAGDQIEVVNIVPPGASPHTFEILPSTIKDLQGITTVFAIGGELDSWTTELLSAIETEVVQVDQGIEKLSFEFVHHHGQEADELGHEEEHEDEHRHHDEELDPHYWLSTINAKIMAKNVADKLIELDPLNSELYQDNLAAYQKQLDQTHEDIESILEDLPARELIVFHESWNYFADEFNLKVVGVFAQSPGKEPIPSALASLHDMAREYALVAVFSEPQLSPKTIRPFVEDLGLQLLVLDPLGGIGERDSLISILKYNAQTIKQAFSK